MKALEEKRLKELQEQETAETSQASKDATVANIEEVCGGRIGQGWCCQLSVAKSRD